MLTVHVLGPVEVHRDGRPIDLGGPQPRTIIAHLALEAGRVVSVEKLIDRLWGDDPPGTPLGTLQSYISRLRRAVEPARATGAAPQVLVSEAPGYVLNVPPEQIDVHRFGALAAEGRGLAAAGNAGGALAKFDQALALWRGPALVGLGADDQARSAVVRLDEERQAVVEDRFEALLALGRHTEAVPALQSAVDDQPLRERLWELLALALYRSSRQADALRALSGARATLLDELGLDPGPALRQLENRILAQDPSLVAVAAGASSRAPQVIERSTAPELELIGRTAEWRTLVGALAAAAAGRSQLALIEGEPGIGKSTLCEAFLAHASAAGWRTAIGRCVEPGLAPSLWPCIEIVRTMIHDDSADSHPDNPLRAVAADHNTGTALSAVEMADHFVSLLDELGGHPWVVQVDDLHWADRATLDVVRLVLERLGSRPVLVIGAHRPPGIVVDSLLGPALGELHRSSMTTRVQMSPLGATDVGRLMEITTGIAPSDDVAERVRSRAGGNPLFVAELARLAGEQGLSDDSVVPDAVRDVVRSRLARLPERATAELQVAAVLGERFDLRTAMAASERDPDSCLDALDAAIVTRIVVPEGDGYRFAHALVRDAVLAELTTLRLARLHHRAAEAILATRGDGPDEAEPIAHHRMAAAAMTDPTVVAKAAVRASDVARWRGALDAADRLANQALNALAAAPRTPQVMALEVEALESLVSSARRRPDSSRIVDVVEQVGEVATRTGSDAARALHLFLTWGPVDESEDLTELADAVERARRLASTTTDSYAIVACRFLLASYAMLLGKLDEAAVHADIAITAVDGDDPDAQPDHVPLALVPVVAGIVAAMRGDADRAIEHTGRRSAAWMSHRSQVDPAAISALAFSRALVRALLNDSAGVVGELRDVRHTSDEFGFVGLQKATCDLLLGWALVKQGDPEGLHAALESMALIDDSDERILRACLRSFVADACLTLGDARAVVLLDAARREAESRHEVWWLSEILRLQAVADRSFGTGSEASRLLDAAERLAVVQGAQLVLTRIAATRAP
jgi:DNA-binding SARP family transcriptional activator